MYAMNAEYLDFNDVKREETLYFHLSKAEVIEWLAQSGDYTLDKVFEKMMNESNAQELVGTIKDLIKRSYGVKSLDGKRFIKNKEVLDAFMESEAYSVIFMRIIGDAKEAANFVNGILPKDLAEEIGKALKDNPEGIPDAYKEYVGALPGA